MVKKKISSKINVQRPGEEILLKYHDQHEPVVNFAEDHILNTVCLTFDKIYLPRLKPFTNNNT